MSAWAAMKKSSTPGFPMPHASPFCIVQIAGERLTYGSDGFIEAIHRTVRERKIFIDQDAIGLHPQRILMLGQRVFILSEIHVNVAHIRPGCRVVGVLARPLLID